MALNKIESKNFPPARNIEFLDENMRKEYHEYHDDIEEGSDSGSKEIGEEEVPSAQGGFVV